MENKITLDTGIKTYHINESGILRFNPSDPNVYKRFRDLSVKIEEMRAEYEKRMERSKDSVEAIDLLADCDHQMKAALTFVFGEWNDFDSIFEGTNIMAVAGNGEMVITNFLDAMRPIIEEGVKVYAKMEAQKAAQSVKRAEK